MSGHGPVPQDPTAFMSFLSDGSLVGPMGEIYCPPTDYFLVDTNGDIPPTLVSPTQGSNFDGKFQQMDNVGRFITKCKNIKLLYKKKVSILIYLSPQNIKMWLFFAGVILTCTYCMIIYYLFNVDKLPLPCNYAKGIH